MTITELRETIAATGYEEIKNMDDQTVIAIGKALKLVSDMRTARAEIVDYTTSNGKKGKFIKTPGVEYVARNAEGQSIKSTARGAFVPIEAVSQIIEDLKAGLELARSQGLVK